jgi:predicted nucleic acid-binding protein
MIVADTNLVAYLLIEGEKTPAARRVWREDAHWLLPPLWRSEFLNVLTLTVRASVLTEAQALRTWRVATALFSRSEREPTGEAVLEAAVRLGLSAYDAQFVVLAEAQGVPLVTGDRKILRACPGLAVSLESFGEGR